MLKQRVFTVRRKPLATPQAWNGVKVGVQYSAGSRKHKLKLLTENESEPGGMKKMEKETEGLIDSARQLLFDAVARSHDDDEVIGSLFAAQGELQRAVNRIRASRTRTLESKILLIQG